MVGRNSGDCRWMRRHIVVRWSVVDAGAVSVAPKRRRHAATRNQHRRRSLAAHLRITVRPTIFRLDTCPTLRRTSSSLRRASRREWRACRSYRLSAWLLCRRPRWCRLASCWQRCLRRPDLPSSSTRRVTRGPWRRLHYIRRLRLLRSFRSTTPRWSDLWWRRERWRLLLPLSWRLYRARRHRRSWTAYATRWVALYRPRSGRQWTSPSFYFAISKTVLVNLTTLIITLSWRFWHSLLRL